MSFAWGSLIDGWAYYTSYGIGPHWKWGWARWILRLNNRIPTTSGVKEIETKYKVLLLRDVEVSHPQQLVFSQ